MSKYVLMQRGEGWEDRGREDPSGGFPDQGGGGGGGGEGEEGGEAAGAEGGDGYQPGRPLEQQDKTLSPLGFRFQIC